MLRAVFRGLPEVAVHVLAQQVHFLVARCEGLFRLPYYGVGVAAAFGASGVGYHAVGAAVVAASHYGYICADAVAVQTQGHYVVVGLGPGQLHVYLRIARIDGRHHFGQPPVAVWPGYQVHYASVEEFVFQAFGHAAHYPYQHFRAFFLFETEYVYPPEDPLFGVLPYRAGVGKYEVGLGHLLRALVSGL